MKSDVEVFALLLDTEKWTLGVRFHAILVGAILLVALAGLAFRLFARPRGLRDFHIDEAEFGIGDNKFKFRPNTTDRQVAYAIWVELATRKIGLPIDPKHDVIEQVYESWYSFFGVTRELIKTIPVTKVQDESTRKIIRLSVDVLNEGLRPHLTKWQARFRRWYEVELKKEPGTPVKDPQDLQRDYPRYDELVAEMLSVNQHLIAYRTKMAELVLGRDPEEQKAPA